ncbi:conserved hypothetical protein [Trichinella spiralis]|uniref:hypothetical protein n=1 Tax=Trichinella spiralis TaxID=6334 RepID=UPI0001EFB240|nr:conserved hypothetical protein [Trichinella spiralis]
MPFFLTLRDKEKHQNRRNRNLRVPSAATKQKFSDDVIHCYQEQNAEMYSDMFSLFNIFHCCHIIKFLLTICDKQRHTGTARKRQIFMYSYSYSDRYSNSIHVTLASSSYLINQIQYLLMNDTICDKQRHTGTARKRLYGHANTGCKRCKLHGMS